MRVPAPVGLALDFEALYRAARDDVFAYVATLLRDRGAAEDVTALAFERAFRAPRSFDAGRGSERAWLFGIARNAALDELRRRSRSAPLDAEPVDATAALEDEAERALRRAAVRAALAVARRARPRDRRAQVPRGPGQRRDRRGPRPQRIQHRHAPAPCPDEAPGGSR